MTTRADNLIALQGVEFDHVFTVTAFGRIADGPEGVYAPEVFHSDEDDIDIVSSDWHAYSVGYTGQYGYSGAVMHASEFLGGRLADDIMSAPGVYVVTTVDVLPEDDDTDADSFPAGWTVLRYAPRDCEYSATDNHSADRLTVGTGDDRPHVLCGYHAHFFMAEAIAYINATRCSFHHCGMPIHFVQAPGEAPGVGRWDHDDRSLNYSPATGYGHPARNY